MITVELKNVTLDGIEYEVEFQEPQVAVLLMSPKKDLGIGISGLMSSAIRACKYINDAGDEDWQDSDISQYLNHHLEDWLLRNWSANIEMTNDHEKNEYTEA